MTEEDINLPKGDICSVEVWVSCPECQTSVGIEMTQGDSGAFFIEDHNRFPCCEECDTAFEAPCPRTTADEVKP